MMLQAAEIPVSPDLAAVALPVGMAVLVAALLYFVRPPVTKPAMVAFTPWMVTGAAVHALYTVDAYPDWADLLFDPHAIYFTTFTAAGMTWAYMHVASELSGEGDHGPQYVAAAGIGGVLVTGGFVLSRAHGAELSQVVPAFGGLLIALTVAGLAYLVVGYFYSKMIIHTGILGGLVVFGHALDGVMTAVAADVFGHPPLYTVGAEVYRYAGTLPTVDLLGQGWLLVTLKVCLALVAVSAGTSLAARDRYRSAAYLGLGALAAYGLGPGVHILLTLVLL